MASLCSWRSKLGLHVQAELLCAALPGVDAPEIDGQMPCDGDDRLLPHRSGGASAFGQQVQALLHGWILRLEPDESPRAFHQRGSQSGVAVLGDVALLAFAAAAVLAGTEAGVGADFAAVVEALPVAHLVAQDRGRQLAQSTRCLAWRGGFQLRAQGEDLRVQRKQHGPCDLQHGDDPGRQVPVQTIPRLRDDAVPPPLHGTLRAALRAVCLAPLGSTSAPGRAASG